MSLIYVASPLDRADSVARRNYNTAALWITGEQSKGFSDIYFSPLIDQKTAHTPACGIKRITMIGMCSKFVVLKIKGWDLCRSLSIDMRYAEFIGKEIEFVEKELWA